MNTGQKIGTRVKYDEGYYWFHSERSLTPAIAEYCNFKWYVTDEKGPLELEELHRRGWEMLGPVTNRPYSHYLDDGEKPMRTYDEIQTEIELHQAKLRSLEAELDETDEMLAENLLSALHLYFYGSTHTDKERCQYLSNIILGLVYECGIDSNDEQYRQVIEDVIYKLKDVVK